MDNYNDEYFDDDDAVYQATPKGLASLALLQSGLVQSTNDPRIDGFWTIFEQSMDKVGYIYKGENSNA